MLDDKFTYVKYILYVICEAQQISFAINILLFQLKGNLLPATYIHQEKICFEGIPVLEKDCCPNYLYSFIPNANSQHEVEKFLFEFIYYKNILYFPSILS